MSSAMKISVIICTRNRPEDVELCLPSVLKNDYPEFEVLLIDQSTNELTKQHAERLAKEYPVLRYIPTTTVGKTLALNIGMQEAKYDIFAFTDDDCETTSTWLQAIAKEYADPNAPDVLFGPVLPSPVLKGMKDICVPAWSFKESRYLRDEEPGGMGANMAMQRSVLANLPDGARFDPLLGPGAPFYAAEERDLDYRLRRLGTKAGLRPSMLLYHRAFRTPERWRRVMYDYGVGDAAFYVKHARCGDKWAARAAFKLAFGKAVKASAKWLLRRPNNDEIPYLRGFTAGVKQSMRTPLDVERRLFIAPV
ncbi:MAG: glycosyltransferase family 2 protein [Capsulimonas sp.]|uniref:glycosyltransferase family 2 protein n=1 Tax=Capsulimonas sp. TaxID=2494211 RepID=UPI0032638FAA